MLINRNNYEDFFLLYADDELNAHERVAVEAFIAANEDLKIELEMIQAAVLMPEEISLTDKSFLYKEIVFDKELQEKLLLKIDNELPAIELANLNSLLQTNIAVKNEYDLLAKTRLDANEKIIFEDKHLLYKKERDNVTIFRFVRWAAAAIFVGIVLFSGVKFLSNKKETLKDIAKSAPKNNNQIENKKAVVNEENNIVNTEPKNNNTEVEKLKNNNTVVDKTSDDKGSTEKEIKDDSKNIVNNKNTVTNKKDNRIIDNNGIQQKENESNISNQFIAKEDKIKLLEKIESKEMPHGNVDIAQNNLKEVNITKENIKPLEDEYAQAVAINNLDKNENKILYIDEDVVKKSKAGGFFRKIKRFVERTANVKTGSTLQIAGFEIAAK